MAVMASLTGYSQNSNFDDIANIRVDENNFVLKFREINDSNEYKKLKVKYYPVYIMDKQYFTMLLEFLDSYSKSAGLSSDLTRLYVIRDSISEQKEKMLNGVIGSQEKRVDLYKDSYDDLVKINEQLSKQLENCAKIADQNCLQKNRNSVFYGILGGIVTGLVIGVVVGK